MAILADTGATVLVVTINAPRLLRWHGPFARRPGKPAVPADSVTGDA